MIVGLYVDEVATGVAEDEADLLGIEPKEYEYQQIEKAITEAFPGERILFKRDLATHQIVNVPLTFYVFDIGGLCRHDFSGERRRMHCRSVGDVMRDNPSTGFVPWSQMTRSSMRAAIDDFVLGEDCREEPDDYKTPEYPNLFLLEKSADTFSLTDADCVAWMKRFHTTVAK